MRSRYTPAVVAALALAVTTGPVMRAAASGASHGTVQKVYEASTDLFANPERGFYRYSETHFTGDRADYRPLDAATMAADRRRDDVTLVFRYFYLDAYRYQDTIDPQDLDLIRADFSAARSAGVKLIVRFAYTDSSGADAPESRVLAHIAQLGPVLTADADVIEALQAGFIGRWGEWYYTDNFASDPGAPWRLSDADWAARGDVLLALLHATPPFTRVQVRYPAIKERIFPDASDPDATRVGVHDDCFLAGTDDYGTFPTTGDRAWLADQTRSVIMGGESCAANPPRSDWSNAATELATYHWSFLNADYHPDVLSSWGDAGRQEAARRLGYRLRLVQATVPSTAAPAQPVQVSLTLTNDGYAAPVSNRPVQLIVGDPDRYTTVPIAADTRTWAPGAAVTLTASFPAPLLAGGYPLYLNLPDPSPNLATQQPLDGATVNAAYAIRLADTGLWDAAHGWNDLAQPLTVAAPAPSHPATSPSPAPPPTPTPTATPTTSPTASPSPTRTPSPTTSQHPGGPQVGPLPSHHRSPTPRPVKRRKKTHR
ncbi:MAG: hypothetical protein V7603_2198 [Micromonosporaceae bacterium]